MRVLQVVNSLTAGGAEKLVVEMTLALQSRNVQTDILLLCKWKSPFSQKLDKHPEIKIISLQDCVSSKSGIYNPSVIFKLRSFFSRYDVIHVHLFPSLYHVALASMLSRNKPRLVFTEHNIINRRRNNILLREIDKIMYRKYDDIVAISESSKEALIKHLGKHFNNVRTINNGIDFDEIIEARPYTKAELGFASKDYLLLQVSSFTPQKDQKTLIRTLGHLDEYIKLILVGEGPLLSEMVDFTKKLGLEDRVTFLGQRKDVPRLLKSVDIIILSSHYEGLSLASIEGMISGKPFISSNVPGLNEVVQGAGVMFTPGDHKELSELINKIKNDNTLYSEIVNKCMVRAEKYSLESMINQYREIYSIEE